MKKKEQHLADELDRRLTAEMQGRPRPAVSGEAKEDAKLASRLIELAAHTEPDPDFVADLGARLAARAAQKATQKKQNRPPERPSFWRDFTQFLKEGLPMNRTKYALGALAALVIVFIAGYALWNNMAPGTGAEPVAVVDTTEETADSAGDETTPEETEEAVAVADLPPIPQLDGSQSGVRGLGGGGGDASALPEGAAAPVAEDMSIMWTDPFSGTTFMLNTDLPQGNNLGIVERQPAEANAQISLEEARELASKFGFTGQLYTEQYPVFEEDLPEGVEPFVPPTTYHVFDGSRTLVMDTWGAYYSDSSVEIDFENPLPFAEAAPIAEAFLQERGLLDFPYEVQQSWGSDVLFVRQVDRIAVNQPSITVTVNDDGSVAFVSYQKLRRLNTLGRYPLISAEEAWQILQSGVSENKIPFVYQPIFDAGEPVVYEDPYADQYQFWMREYEPGDEIHLYEWPRVFHPADGSGPPRLQIRMYLLEADEATLNAIAAELGRQIHVWGQISPDGKSVQVAGWELMPETHTPISQPGVIQRSGDQVLFVGSESGDTYIIPDAPADLPDGLEVYIFGWNTRDIGAEYPALDWENIDKIVERPDEPLPVEPDDGIGYPEPRPIEPGAGADILPFEPFRYENVSVTAVELAYYYTYVFPTGENGEQRFEGPPDILIQPTWKFTGEADNGDVIDFYVQAVSPEFLSGQ